MTNSEYYHLQPGIHPKCKRASHDINLIAKNMQWFYLAYFLYLVSMLSHPPLKLIPVYATTAHNWATEPEIYESK